MAPGWLTWGGLSVEQKRSFAELKVVGQHHWAVSMRHLLPGMKLSPEQQAAAGTLFCERGCAAILDSGTSLISAPSHALKGLELLLPKLHSNCSNLKELPDLKLELDGHRIRLPPEAYVMRLGGSFVNAMSVWEKLYMKPSLALPDQCFYGFLSMDAHTDFGPLWVLGMPFFRYFHVTFGLARNVTDRRIWLAEATDDCTPLPLEGSDTGAAQGDPKYSGTGVYPKIVVVQRHQVRRRADAHRQVLTVDAGSLRLPRISGPL
uniref:Peptidase A1 domain-containing protein n=1 Tax=Pyrodinium bahamense TaxID=73915 RepID=A0A7S0F864_9DINO|mmetsp:Transcript_11425/g.31209  ORF Transcript_11425/g.31209 Transcript_11425/m.31209 type:complete len:262 (+) Transcript_11425:111-896(+)